MVIIPKYNPEKTERQLERYISSAAIKLYDEHNYQKAKSFLEVADVKFNVIACRMNDSDFFSFGEVREMENRLNALGKDLVELEVENE